MERLFLLDAYALIYRAYYAMIQSPRINSKGMNVGAILGFVNTLDEVISKEKPEYIGIAFDPHGGTFRHECYAEYKAQREETPEDIKVAVPIIKEIIKAYNIPILEVPGFEADDVIGTLAWQASEKGVETYMLTPDKDYCQLVRENVKIYRPKHGGGYEILDKEGVLEKYDIKETSQIIDLLGLMGDSADNIPGCPGVGPKTAQKLLKDFDSIENLLANTVQLKGSLKDKIEANREKIRFSRLLATIRTDVPVELDLRELKHEKPNMPELRKIFAELEFRSHLRKMAEEEVPSVKDEKPDRPAATEKKIKSVKKNAQSDMGFFGDLFSMTELDSEDEKQALQSPIFAARCTEKNENENLRGSNRGVIDYITADTEEVAEEYTHRILVQEKVAFYTWYVGNSPMEGVLKGIAFAYSDSEPAVFFPEEIAGNMDRVKKIMESDTFSKTGHNMKYDLTVLKRRGIELKGEMFDCMVAHYVMQPEQHHYLDYLTDIYLGQQPVGLNRTEKWEDCCHKAKICLALQPKLKEALEKDGTYSVFRDIEMPLVEVLSYIEQNGVRVDTAALAETSAYFGKRMEQLEREITELAGCTFNIQSPKQVGEVLFDKLKLSDKAKKTKTGQYITNEEVLEGLRGKHPIIDKILQHRGLKKLTGTYIDALPALINPETGKIHTSFNQTVTATGRLSSSNPNLQNIPIRDEDGKEVRKAFIPEPGCKFFSADYSQIELRIMAHLSGDVNMIEDFLRGHDVHAATASKIFHKDIGEISSRERRMAKTANFGIIYGISVFGLAERMQVSRAEAKLLIENYFKTYSGIKSFMEEQKEIARKKGYIETIFHRKRYLPDINSHNAVVRGYAERNAINAPIQGSAADIIKVAMVNIYREFKKRGIKSAMILQVHDELNFSVVPGEEEIVQEIVIRCMQQAYSMSVPLIADCGWGDNWLQAH